jgi:type VI secretion system protein VasI
MKISSPAVAAMIALFAAVSHPAHAQTAPSPSRAATGIDPKELARCAANNNPVLRLSCFDDLAKKFNQAPKTVNTTSSSKGAWRTSTDMDPLTDKSVHFAIIDATEARGRFGDRISMVVRCKNEEIEAYINWNTFLGTDEITVTHRVDKSPATTATWSISTDHKASFMPEPQSTLERFLGAASYVVNLTPYSESPITAIFNIAGAEQAFRDIRRDCQW